MPEFFSGSGGAAGAAAAPRGFTDAGLTTPTAYWPCDDASGNLADAVGTNDLIKTGSIIGYEAPGPNNVVSGVIGGQKSVYIHEAATDYFISTTANGPSADFSVSCWLKVFTENGNRRLFGWADSAKTEATLYIAYTHPTFYQVGYQLQSTAEGAQYQGALGEWQNIVMTRSSGTPRLYINGVLFHTGANNTHDASSGDFHIGGLTSAAGAVVSDRARFSSIAYWDGTVLDASDVSALWNDGAGSFYA